jgi:hypothetical protein
VSDLALWYEDHEALHRHIAEASAAIGEIGDRTLKEYLVEGLKWIEANKGWRVDWLRLYPFIDKML